MSPELWAAIAGLLLVSIVTGLYNRLSADRNLVRQGYAGIDVQLKRRAGLVPQLAAAASKIQKIVTYMLLY